MRLVGLFCALLVSSPDALAQCGGDRTPSPFGANGRFGATIAVDGDDMIVGAPDADSVAFYRWSGAAWAPAGAPVTGPTGVGYGSSVAIGGGVAFVGLPLRDAGGQIDSGLVQVLTSPAPGIWNAAGSFGPSFPSAGGRFGHDVDTDGARVIVGEPGFSGDRGRAHVYTIGAGGAVLIEQAFTWPGASAGEQLGHSVAIDGVAAAAGAPYADTDGQIDNGRGTFFRRAASGVWHPIQYWTFLGSSIHAGWSIDVSGPFGVVGAPGISSSNGGYIFAEWNGVDYGLDTFSSSEEFQADLGFAVALDGNRGIVCGPGDGSHFGPSPNVGTFELFEHDGVEFVPVNLWDAYPMHTPSLRFGEGVGLSGSRLVVGAPADPTAGPDAGAFFEYDASISAWQYGFQANTSLAGVNPAPDLYFEGSFCADDPFWFAVDNAWSNVPVVVVVGLQFAPTPLLGGTLGPTPDLLLTGLSTAPPGKLEFLSQMPPAVPVGLDLYLQAWVADPTGPQGYTATSTMFLTTPF